MSQNIKVNVRLHSYPNNHDMMHDLIATLINQEQYGNYKVEEQILVGNEESVFSIQLENQSKCKDLIEALYYHKDVGYEDYNDILPFDFTVSVETGTIDSTVELASALSERNYNQQFNDIHYLLNLMTKTNNNLNERLEAVEEYLKKSGIVNYEPMIDAFLTVLEQQGLIESKQYIIDMTKYKSH